MAGPVIIVILAIIFLVLFFSFVPLGLWISAAASGVRVGIFQLVGMRVRKVIPSRIVNPMIKATKAGLNVSINKLEAHYLAGEKEKAVIVAKGVLPEAGDLLQRLSPGSRIKKAPEDMFPKGTVN